MSESAFSATPASPWRYRDFRVLWASGVLAGACFQGETVALGWLLLDRTDSPFVVGAGVALRLLPSLLLGIPGGALVDRVDRRRLIRTVGSATGLFLLAIALLQFNGLLGVAALLALTACTSCTRSLEPSARTSYAVDIVGPARIVSANAVLSIGQRLGSTVGALGVGALLEEFGPGQAYLAVALAQLSSAAVMLAARGTGQAQPTSRPPVLQGMREFFAEMGHNRPLLLIILLVAAVEVLGFSYMSLMPSVARDVMKIDAGGLGLITAFGSAMAMLTVLLVSLRQEIEHVGLTFLFVTLSFGLALVMLGLSSGIVLALLAIGTISSMAALSDLLSQSLVQSAVPNDLRGRAMGAWLLAIGFGPVGHLQIGALAALAGVTTALVTNGLLLVLLALLSLAGLRSLRSRI